jgi:hypothetical protein
MPRAKATAAASPEVTIRMPNTAPPAAPPEEKEKPFFWQRVSEIPAERWEKDIEIWIYRLEPKVRMAAGERGYLDILTQPITPVYIKQKWGGGTFRIMVLEKGKLMFSTIEEIEGDPIYDKRREVSAPAAAANGTGTMGGDVMRVLEQQNERLYEVLTTLQGAKDENPAIGSAIEILTTAYKTGLSTVSERNGNHQDPEKHLEGILKIAERIVSVRGGGGGGGLTEAIALLNSLGVLQKPKSIAEQLKEAKELGELLGGGGGESVIKSPWLQAIKMIEPHLPEILDTFKTSSSNTIAAARARADEARARQAAADSIRSMASAGAPQPAAAAPPAAAPPARASSGLNVVPIHSEDQAAPAAAAAAPPAAVPTTQEQYDAAFKIQCVNMMRMGASGGSIAAFLEDVKPDLAEDLSKYPAQVITDFFAADPILKLMIEDPRWDAVLADAKDYLADDPPPN